MPDFSNKMNSGQVKVELYMDGEPLDPKADRRILARSNIREKTVSAMIAGSRSSACH